MKIVIVGLGPGDPGALTRQAWDVLSAASEVYLRTARHPTVESLPVGPAYHSFDAHYEAATDFVALYEQIAQEVAALGRRAEGVIYAVPGHPLVGEATVTRLLALARDAGIAVDIVGGMSFVEPVLAALHLDGLSGLQVLDAVEVAAMHHPPINPDAPALLAQLYDRTVASDVKLVLMNQYPDDHPVALVHAAGMPDERVEHVPLHEIDRSPYLAHLTTLYVGPLPQASSFEAFQETIAHLRAPDGCPWDRKQTHQTLRRNLLEETYEVLDALDAGDADAMCEEFGDLLLQVVLHSQIAVDEAEFKMADVIAGINEKIIRRHPHVWGDVRTDDAEQVIVNWEQLKKQERRVKGNERASLLDGVPKTLPALDQSFRYQERAARVGFDWPDIEPVRAKVMEELDEVVAAQTPASIAAELGDLLFAIVNWARWLGVDPESALRETNARFYRRFRHIEATAAAQGRELSEVTLEEMDAIWEEAKAGER